MPQASDKLRELMHQWFGRLEEGGPIAFLESHGYRLTAQWLWKPPARFHTISDSELLCLRFLIQEWDFGGLLPYSWEGEFSEAASAAFGAYP